jgi:DNA-binding HxlR family transcriptional regulator
MTGSASQRTILATQRYLASKHFECWAAGALKRSGGFVALEGLVESRDCKLTTPGILRLLSAGAGGRILMALGDGPLRTKQLTGRVRGYAPRTVYRHASKLTELGIVERREETGVPSKVEYRLTDPCGKELFSLIHAYAVTSLTRLPNGEIDARAWGSLGLLGDLWESGMLEALNLGPKTTTELSRGEHGLAYHQVNRRAGMFAVGGLLREEAVNGRRRAYALTGRARRGMALIAGIGRWRRRYVVSNGRPGLSPREAGGVLQTALPLVSLPEHAGKGLCVEIAAEEMEAGAAKTVWARVRTNGSVHSCPQPLLELDGHVHGRTSAFIDALIDGAHNGLRAEGDEGLIETFLSKLHAVLWGRRLGLSPPPPEALASGGNGT